MKKISDNIQTLLLLFLLLTGLIACTHELEEMESVTVAFTASLPDEARTRAFADGMKVNTLVVGVFAINKNEPMKVYTFPISADSAPTQVELVLAKLQTYKFVFWAYNKDSGVYDVTNPAAITMRSDVAIDSFDQAESVDAFCATVTNFIPEGNTLETVYLTRPLAQINVGTSGPAVETTFIVKDAANTFYPFTGTVGGKMELTWNFASSVTEPFVAEEKEYTYLAMGYLFAPLQEPTHKVACQLILREGEEEKTVDLPIVELRGKYRSNIVGSFTKKE